MQMQTIQYIAMKFYRLILKNITKLHRWIYHRTEGNTYLCICAQVNNISTYKNIISTFLMAAYFAP